MQRFKSWMPWLLMAGNFGFPGATAIIAWVYLQKPLPFLDEVDWNGASPPAQTNYFFKIMRQLVVRREVGSPKTIKYSLSNAPADTPRGALMAAAFARSVACMVRNTDLIGAVGVCSSDGFPWPGWR